MAVSGCDAVRQACDELRKAAELHDTAVAKAEANVRANPDDDSAKFRAASAYEEKCRQMNDVISTNIPVIETKLKEAKNLIQEDVEELDIIEKENVTLKQEKKELKETLEVERTRNEEAKLEEASLDAQLSDATKAAQTARKAASQYEDKGPFNYQESQGRLYSKLLADKMHLLTILEKYKVLFAHHNTAPKPHGHGYDLQRLEQAEFDELKTKAQDWNENQVGNIQAEIDALEATKTELIAAGWPEEHADICDTTEKFQQVKKAAEQWGTILAGEDKRRTDMKGTLDKFMKDDAKLLQWCRQERTNMEAQSEPHHVQEFCKSLIQNIGTMEENFAHLGDTGEALLPNKVVERALVEVNEVWLNLQINAYERQRHIMLEIHQKSKLENEVRAFSNFSKKLEKFFKETIEVLQIPTDQESKDVVAPVLNQCQKLLAEFGPHGLLSHHLSDFSLRMEHIRDNYNVLRRTVFSKLTFLSTDRRIVDEVSSQRKEEYLGKVGEIKAWLKAHSEGENWESIHGKVKRLQELIDKQLNPEQEQEPEPANPVAEDEEEEF